MKSAIFSTFVDMVPRLQMICHRLWGAGIPAQMPGNEFWTVVVGTRSVRWRAKCSCDHPNFEIYRENNNSGISSVFQRCLTKPSIVSKCDKLASTQELRTCAFGSRRLPTPQHFKDNATL